MSIRRRFPIEPVTALAKGPTEFSPIANPVMEDVDTIPLFWNREGAKAAKLYFCFFRSEPRLNTLRCH